MARNEPSEAWRREASRIAGSFDRVADLYRRAFERELEGKPFDRELLERFAEQIRIDAGPVLEVGAGIAHVSGFLAERGVSMLASDVSMGQLREGRLVAPSIPLAAADLARLPVRAGSLAGIVAFYSLIYGAAPHLDAVFADWHRALRPGGRVLIAVHAGEGSEQIDEWQGRNVDIHLVLRDPVDLARRLERAGFRAEEPVVRGPYEGEYVQDRCYLMARRSRGG